MIADGKVFPKLPSAGKCEPNHPTANSRPMLQWCTEPRTGFPGGVLIVSITPIKTTFETKGRSVAQMQLPLWLAWAVIVHKLQGLTISRVWIGLERTEFCSSLMFVALSRAKSLDTLVLVKKVDYSHVQKLGRRNLQFRNDDLACRYHA